MSSIEAIILGVIQGLTEFFPVSSSGHLTLFQAFLGFQNLQSFLFFDLICHLGTLFSILIVFRKDLYELATTHKERISQIILGTLPLFPLVLILKPIKSLFDQTYLLGFFFILTSGILYLGIRFGSTRTPESLAKSRYRDALAVGVFQAFAILPGVSRSGLTITGARLLGWDAESALRFSFLLAVPAILGGIALELLGFFTKGVPADIYSLGWSAYLLGFIFSFLVGCAALIVLKQLAVKQQFMYFVWYCFLLGIATTLYFNV